MFNWNKKIFYDRKDAGQKLARILIQHSLKNSIILALPRGGVPVGFEIAKSLHIPLSVIVVRKIGSPRQVEFGIGAVAESDIQILDQQTINRLGISQEELKDLIDRELKELKRRVQLYRKGRVLPMLKSQTVILVDDGLATGITAEAAIKAVKKLQPEKIIFASPVCAKDSVLEIRSLIDDLVCLKMPSKFNAVGNWYQNFPQISDQEVIEILKSA